MAKKNTKTTMAKKLVQKPSSYTPKNKNAKKKNVNAFTRFIYTLFPFKFNLRFGPSALSTAALVFSLLTAASSVMMFLGGYILASILFIFAGVSFAAFFLVNMRKPWLVPLAAMISAAAVFAMRSPVVSLVALPSLVLILLSTNAVKRGVIRTVLLFAPSVAAAVPMILAITASLVWFRPGAAGFISYSVFAPVVLLVTVFLVSVIEVYPNKAGMKAASKSKK